MMTSESPVRTRERVDQDEIMAFEVLKEQLRVFWRELRLNPAIRHTSVIVPSLSVNQEELAKVPGAAYYEERLLFTLIRLKSPGARVIYLSSQPIHPDTIDYYLQLLVGVPASHAKRRLLLLCMQDASPRPLTQKILERPKVIARLREWIGDPQRAYITCYNSTALERRLAVTLGVPLNGTDPELLELGTKSGSRKVFHAAGVATPDGFEDLHSEEDVVKALLLLRERHPHLERAVVKLNESFSGEGNALFSYPEGLPDSPDECAATLYRELDSLKWPHAGETRATFFRKFADMGGIVEEFVSGTDLNSPSAQLRARPDGEVRLVSTHDQLLGSPTGQVYLGCRFPAAAEYRAFVRREAEKIGEVVARRGVVGRFGVDFLVFRDAQGEWQLRAVEINLRMGGTTPPFMALEFLTSGEFDEDRGSYVSRGKQKFYSATDNLKSPAYKGLLAEDLFDILTGYGIRFEPGSETGVLFYMIGALSEFGKLGVVSIGDSREEADELYQHTVAILDRETDAAPTLGGHLHPLFFHGPAGLE